MNNKKGIIVFIIILAMIFSNITFADASSSQISLSQTNTSFYVNPIPGLRSDFIKGADVSMLSQIEQCGGKFYDNGVEKDLLQILKDHGVNWIRLRIWNNPVDSSGNPLGGGNNDEKRTIEMAKRAKALGLKLLLDFHYSDFWADPGKQNKPAAWANDHGTKLQEDVYDFTAKVINDMKANNVLPDMVQIGNEIDNGILWPDGEISGEGAGGYSGLAALLQQGIKAVRDNDPNNNDPEKKIKIMIHLSNGGNNALYRSFFDNLIYNQGVTDFDVIGLSYYPYWSGTLDELKNNINDISQRYNKDIVIAETAYAYTLNNADNTENNFGSKEEAIGGYKASVEGQATAIRDVMAAVSQVPNNKGLGVFYWEPDWIPVVGAGWKTGEGDGWENQALFDFNGNALPSIDVFNLVSGNQGTIIPQVLSIEPVNVSTTVNQAPVLPTTVNIVYDDGSVKPASVIWENIDPSKYAQPGSFTIIGTVSGIRYKAIATVAVTSLINYVQNPGFEDGSLTNWNVSGDTSAVKIDKNAANAHSGKYSLNYWSDNAFTVTISQTITGLKNGYYQLSAYVDGGGGENSLQLFASDYGGSKLTEDVHNSGWLVWQHPTIPLIKVTNGQVTVGLTINGNSGNWGNFDDIQLIQVDDSGNPIGGPISTVLTTPSYVNSSDVFDIGYGLKDISQTIYAQEIMINYDPQIFDFVKATATDDNTIISKVYNETPGTIIIDAVNSKGLTTDTNLISLTFNAKIIDQLTYSNISISEAKLQTNSDRSNYIDAALSSNTIAVEGTATMTLSSPNSVFAGEDFTAEVSISDVSQAVYSQDIILNYDPRVFEILSLDNVGNSMIIDSNYDNSQGIAKILGVDIGGLSGTNDDIIKLTIHAKKTLQSTSGYIMIRSAQLGTAPEGNIIFPKLTSTNIKIISANVGNDENGTGTTNTNSGNTNNLVNDGEISVKPSIDYVNGISTVSLNVDDLNRAMKNAKTSEDGTKNVVISIPKFDGLKQYDIIFPAPFLASNDEKQEVQLTMGSATAIIPTNMFNEDEIKQSKEITFSFKNIDKLELRNELKQFDRIGAGIDFSIKIDGTSISWNNPDSHVVIEIPYTPTSEELKDLDHIVALYIDNNGSVSPIPNSIYGTKSGELIFRTTHSGKYVEAFIHKTFSDISGNWAQNAIEVLASKGVTNGTSKNLFSPNLKITRADYITMLLAAIGLTAKVDQNFSDIQALNYYYNSVGIAKKLGIVSGVGDNKFDPNDPIKREDMFVMTANALKLLGISNSTGTSYDLNKFTDINDISQYAVESIATLVKSGIVNGKDNNKIDPRNYATRAEAAAVIYNVIKDLEK